MITVVQILKIDTETDDNGRVNVAVPPMGYIILGSVGIEGGFNPSARRTTQEFQMDDDLGDSDGASLKYGGKICYPEYRTGGTVWIAKNTLVKVWVYPEGERNIELRVNKPDLNGEKSKDNGSFQKKAIASNDGPLYLEFTADREGYHQLLAKITRSTQSPTRAYIKIEYEAPAISDKF